MTPHEEVIELIEKIKVTIETLEGTDHDLFDKSKLRSLNEVANKLARTSFELAYSMEDEEEN